MLLLWYTHMKPSLSHSDISVSSSRITGHGLCRSLLISKQCAAAATALRELLLVNMDEPLLSISLHHTFLHLRGGVARWHGQGGDGEGRVELTRSPSLCCAILRRISASSSSSRCCNG